MSAHNYADKIVISFLAGKPPDRSAMGALLERGTIAGSYFGKKHRYRFFVTPRASVANPEPALVALES